MTIPAIAPPLIPVDEDSLPEAEAEAGATMLTVEEELDCERLDEDECVLLEDVMLLYVLVEVRALVDVVVGIKDDDEEEEVVSTASFRPHNECQSSIQHWSILEIITHRLWKTRAWSR